MDSTMTENTEQPLHQIVAITNQRGLHARAAAKFVKCCDCFPNAEIAVRKEPDECGYGAVSGKSIMGLMMLAVGIGSHIAITATGNDAAPALAALVDLVTRKFDEDA